jgi:hypothetical protein
MQEAREAARKEDPEGYLEQRRAEMNEYRRKKRIEALEAVVEMVHRDLGNGGTVVDVATALEAMGVRAPKP